MTDSTTELHTLHLKRDRHKRIQQGHLWAFAGEITESLKEFAPGDVVAVCESRGALLGRGYVNPHSLIAVRLMTRGKEIWDDGFFVRRIRSALEYRRAVLPGVEAYRLIYSESDGLPGLIVDKFGDYLILQSQTAGIERMLPEIVKALEEVIKPKGILAKGGSQYSEIEGLPEEDRVLSGTVPEEITFYDTLIPFTIHPYEGQKTGFFLDQSANRAYLSQFSDGATVCDLYSYMGAWGLTALKYGALSAVMVDSSAKAIEWAKRNAGEGGIAGGRFVKADVSVFMDDAIRRGDKYDIVVLDPPALIKSGASEAAGTSMYVALNAQALQMVAPGGYLVSCSCSHLLGRAEHLAVLGASAVKAKRKVRVVKQGGHAPDHPILPGHPETEYLTCFYLQVE